MLHSWIVVWFGLVRDGGYLGIVLLMAMESSILPVPSEIVIPPAAYWAAQGKYDFWGVILAGTVGSYIGSAAMYWVARWIGRPLVIQYGKFFFVSGEKLLRAERWLARYEAGGIFFARLLPVIRHLIGIPAGIVRMDFKLYSLMTIVGSGLWCWVLASFGVRVIGDRPELLNDPGQLMAALKDRFHWFVGLILVLVILYVVVMRLTAKPASAVKS